MDVTVEIKGLQELEARLQEIDALAGQRLLTKVLRWVAAPLDSRARANAYSVSKNGSSGALSRSVAIVNRKPIGAQVARVSVTSKKDRTAIYLHNSFYGRKRKGIFYGWMVERGHRIGHGKTGYLRKEGRTSGGYSGSTGRVAGRPWFQPALSASTGQMTSDFVKYLTVAINRIEKRKSKTANPEGLVP